MLNYRSCNFFLETIKYYFQRITIQQVCGNTKAIALSNLSNSIIRITVSSTLEKHLGNTCFSAKTIAQISLSSFMKRTAVEKCCLHSCIHKKSCHKCKFAPTWLQLLQLLQTVCGQKVFENFPINVRVCLEEK